MILPVDEFIRRFLLHVLPMASTASATTACSPAAAGRQHRPDPGACSPHHPPSGSDPSLPPPKARQLPLAPAAADGSSSSSASAGASSAGAPDHRRQDRHVMITASNTTAIIDRRLARPSTRPGLARAIEPNPASSTQHSASSGHHPDAAPRSRAPISAPAAPSAPQALANQPSASPNPHRPRQRRRSPTVPRFPPLEVSDAGQTGYPCRSLPSTDVTKKSRERNGSPGLSHRAGPMHPGFTAARKPYRHLLA